MQGEQDQLNRKMWHIISAVVVVYGSVTDREQTGNSAAAFVHNK